MNEIVIFDRDVSISIGQNETLKLFGFGGTNWFYLDGKYFGEWMTEKVFSLPKGKYSVRLNRNLKWYNNDFLYLCNNKGMTFAFLKEESVEFELEKETDVYFYFSFGGANTNYFRGEYFEEQEDYGKDYQIILKVLSGGYFDRPKEKAIICGDTNGDGRIDIEDLANVRMLLLGAKFEDESLDRYDANGDGIIDGIDLLMIRKHILASSFIDKITYQTEKYENE
jgi:hypothetical protein